MKQNPLSSKPLIYMFNNFIFRYYNNYHNNIIIIKKSNNPKMGTCSSCTQSKQENELEFTKTKEISNL